ncbi:MAG: ATP-dependent DNA helicase [Sulfuricurvum sp.]|nr:ATP-dependent DNA helicase [Sulfuricurvum sp.]
MRLNENQTLATEILDQNLQIIACAGSGKTQVVSLRIINLLKRGVSPANIVAFTFTEKAAAELKHRVHELSKSETQISNFGLAEMYIGTIHSWCWHLLQDQEYGLQKCEILDDIKLKLFVDRAYKKAGMHELGMKGYVDTGLFLNLMSIIREAELKDGKNLPHNLIAAKEKFESYLNQYNYLDFTMILTRFLDEMKNHNSLLYKYVKNTVKYLIVDEYQDVNYIQEKIIRSVYETNCNLCVVGDDDQTIYQWRGSNVKNILDFQKNYDDVKTVYLNENYRSSNAVVDIATKIVAEIPNDKRLQKQMFSASHQKFEQGDLIKNSFKTQAEEVEYIVNTIKNLRGVAFHDKPNSEARGLNYSDICILLRNWSVADTYADALQNAGIPYVVAGVNRLFQQAEVVACHNIFRYLKKEISRNQLITSWISLSDNIDLDKLDDAIKYVDKYEYDLTNDTWYEYFILQEVFEKFRERLEISEDTFSDEKNELGMERGEIIFYNMGMFSQIIQDFETIHFKDQPSRKLTNFLNFIQYTAANYYPEGWLNKSFGIPNAVTIMTVHQAKGLEFPAVFIPSMNRNYFPGKKVGGKNVWHFLDKELIKDQERYEGNVIDERRLFYVAITRAKKFLFVTRAPKPTKNNLYGQESIFYSDLKKSDFIFQSNRDYSERKRSTIKSQKKIENILLNFSLLESYFECPYKFKYYVLYGFSKPLSSRIGFGKSIHDSLMEIHRRSLDDDIPKKEELDAILNRHISFPYAIKETSDQMEEKAKETISAYYDNFKNDLKNLEYAEKDIELDFGNGILVNGRIDLIKKRELNQEVKTYIVDFKSKLDPERQNITFQQLKLYSLGYEELTGKKADFMQIYDFDKAGAETAEILSQDMMQIKSDIIKAAQKIQSNDLNHKCNDKKCPCRFKK